MSLKKQFGTNQDKEKEGVWVEVGIEEVNEKPIRFKIARLTQRNKEYQKTVTKHGRKYQNVNNIPADVALAISQKAFVDCILLNWENVLEYRTEQLSSGFPSPNGEMLMPYNKANATFLMKDLPDLYLLLSNLAASPETFMDEDEEADLKPDIGTLEEPEKN